MGCDKQFMLDSLELILYITESPSKSNKEGDVICRDQIIIKEGKKVQLLAVMEQFLKRAIEEYGIPLKKGTVLNMLLYGNKTLEKYLKDTKSITKMEISSITYQQILNLLPLCTINEYTQAVNLEMTDGGNPVVGVEKCNQSQNTTSVKMEFPLGVNGAVLKMQLLIKEKGASNFHSTVKPTSLMQYLCRLITPPGGVVLDPFCGSGSTGKAAIREGFGFIGIDLSPEYIEIARARIENEERKMRLFSDLS
jgi:tRNA/tmRNA/rRNA uracil-C5-methylase (TrmA/RlmC/RlmD family)